MTPQPDGPPMQQKGWFGRNWKWLVPVGCLTPILCCGTFGAVTFFGVSKMIQGSGAYVTAIARATSDAQVTAALGTPLAPGFMMQGEIKEVNGKSTADFNVPLEGPKGKGTLYVIGTATGGEWTFSRLEVQLPDGKTVDLNAGGGGGGGSAGPPPDDSAPPPDDPPDNPDPTSDDAPPPG